jgi:hypothetical protein
MCTKYGQDIVNLKKNTFKWNYLLQNWLLIMVKVHGYRLQTICPFLKANFLPVYISVRTIEYETLNEFSVKVWIDCRAIETISKYIDKQLSNVIKHLL